MVKRVLGTDQSEIRFLVGAPVILLAYFSGLNASLTWKRCRFDSYREYHFMLVSYIRLIMPVLYSGEMGSNPVTSTI